MAELILFILAFFPFSLVFYFIYTVINGKGGSKGITEEYRLLISYSKKLKFDTEPNYDYLINLFQKLLINSGYKYDKKYDWVTTKERELVIN